MASKLSKKDLKALLAAGGKALGKSVAVARRRLEPVRAADPQAWAELLREKAEALLEKDPGRAEAILGTLVRSTQATNEDRYRYATIQLERSPMDLHPKARQRDPALGDFERLAEDGFPVAKALQKDRRVSDEGRYYVAFHLAETKTPEARSAGYALLEALAGKGKGKVTKAAKNKLELLESAA